MKKIVISIVIILIVGIQFIPAGRSNQGVISDFDGPEEVEAILRRSCYDCHSNESKWPWYSRVAPVSWFVAGHVKEGREHLNFSDWAPIRDNMYIREEIYEETAEGKMPLKSYLLMHSGAKVTKAELETLKTWAGE